MQAEIINIGDELLIGQVVNTNASWMAEQFNLNGIEVVHIAAISDQLETIKSSIDDALTRADLVILTGGLGPTKDDITKQALCDYFNTTLTFNEEAYQQVKELFKNRGFEVTERNKHQAMLPSNCTPLQNIEGTAPGMWFNHQNKVIISIPGVPFEMRSLISTQIIPRIKERFDTKEIHTKTILVQGIGESHLADRISEWEASLPEYFKLAYLPQPGIVRLRISATVEPNSETADIMQSKVDELHKLIPELIWGYESDTFEQVVGRLLKKHQKSIATAESCSGGNIAHLLTSVAGSSDYFFGGIVAYSNEVKARVLDVNETTLEQFGAVSKEVVKEMALGAQKLLNTDYALATSGIAGPDGGSVEKPVGTTWIALAKPDKTVIAKKYLFGEHRGRNIRKTSITALNLLRADLLDSE